MAQVRNSVEKTAQAQNIRSIQDNARQEAQQHLLTWGLLLLLCLLACGFDLYRLGTPSIWFDEAFSVELARQPLPLLWHIIFGPEPNMELYYLFLHYWLAFTHLLGFNPVEFVVRFPSAIFAALSTGVVFLLGRRFLTTTAGTVGAALYLLNDLQLTYAQQTRSYSLQLLLLCLAWYALLVALTTSTRQRRWWLCYIVVSVLAVYAQLFSGLVLLAQVVTVACLLLIPQPWQVQTRKQLLALVVSLCAIGVLCIPMLLVSLHGAKTGWLDVPHWHDLIDLFATISGYNKPYLLALSLCAVAGALAVLVLYGVQLVKMKIARQERGESTAQPKLVKNVQCVPTTLAWFPFTLALLCWLLIPTLVSYEISHTSLRLFSSRYLVVIVPPLCLLMGLTVAMLYELLRGQIGRLLQIVLALLLLGLALTAAPLYYRSAQVEDWNSTSHWLIEHYQAGDGLVCYDNEVEQGCQISVEYYLDAYPSAAHFDANSPGAFSWENFGPANPASGYDAAVDPTALAAYAAQHPRLFFITGRIPTDADAARALAAQHWLDSHYHFIAQIVTRTVTIRLYATK
jgi:uncharacterized membrane protein